MADEYFAPKPKSTRGMILTLTLVLLAQVRLVLGNVSN